MENMSNKSPNCKTCKSLGNTTNVRLGYRATAQEDLWKKASHPQNKSQY